MQKPNTKNVEIQSSQFVEAWVEQFRPYAKRETVRIISLH